MADTVINNPNARREYDAADSSLAGWIVALAIVVVLVMGAIYLVPRLANMNNANTAPTTPSTIDVNLSVPEGAIPGAQNNQGGGNTNQAPQQAQ